MVRYCQTRSLSWSLPGRLFLATVGTPTPLSLLQHDHIFRPLALLLSQHHPVDFHVGLEGIRPFRLEPVSVTVPSQPHRDRSILALTL
jgi:hypothetical protein